MQNSTFTIAFEPLDSCAPQPITGVYGSNITLPNCSSPDLFFYGWFEDANNTLMFNRDTMPGRNVTLHGVAVPEEYLQFCAFTSGWCNEVDCINPCNGACGGGCDEEGHITSISADGKGLRAIDGSVIKSFKYLTELGLNGNELTTLPDEITSLRLLNGLHLGHNDFSFIPDAIFNIVTLTKL